MSDAQSSVPAPGIAVGVGVFALIVGAAIIVFFPISTSGTGVSGALGTPGWVLGGLCALFGLALIVGVIVDAVRGRRSGRR